MAAAVRSCGIPLGLQQSRQKRTIQSVVVDDQDRWFRIWRERRLRLDRLDGRALGARLAIWLL